MKNSFSWDDKPKAIPGPNMGTNGLWNGLDDSVYSEINGVPHGYHELYDHNGFLWYRGNFNYRKEIGYTESYGIIYTESYGIIEGHIYFLHVYYHIQ